VIVPPTLMAPSHKFRENLPTVRVINRVGQKSKLLYCDRYFEGDNSRNVKYSIIL